MMTGMAQWNNVGSLCYFIVASIVGTCVMAAVSALSGQHLSSSQHLSHQRSDDIRQLYIDTLKKSVTGILLQTEGYKADTTAGLSDLQKLPFDLDKRTNGLDFPVHGITMVGLKRLDNLEALLRHLDAKGVPGDLVECGVWRGGASLFMRGLLKAHGITNRNVHLVDSFEGLPKASTTSDDDFWSQMEILRVSLPEVQSAFERYGLLDTQVHFHKGFFRNSLPVFRAKYQGTSIALLRMDGDMYESTMDILYNLADLLSPGACVVVDDWTIPECQSALKDFFGTHSISPEIHIVDSFAAYFCLDSKLDLNHEWYTAFNAKRVL